MKIMKFEASWCGPCKMSKPTWEKFKGLHSEIECIEIDVDAEPMIAQEYNVMSIPAFIAIERGIGKENKSFVGLPKLENLEDLLV